MDFVAEHVKFNFAEWLNPDVGSSILGLWEGFLTIDGVEVVDDHTVNLNLDAPLLANLIDGGVTPVLPLSELQDLGFAVATYSLGATYVVARAMHDYLHHLAEHQSSAGYQANMLTFDEFNQIVGLGELRNREAACLDFANELAGIRTQTR